MKSFSMLSPSPPHFSHEATRSEPFNGQPRIKEPKNRKTKATPAAMK
jgi:hypothetical protein